MPKPRDYQKMKVYKWEENFINPHFHRILSWEEIDAVVHASCALYGLRPPKIKTVKARINSQRRAMAYADHTIVLPKWARTRDVVIHETAHIVTAAFGYSPLVADHGPEFVRVFMNLLSMAKPRLETNVWMMDHMERTASHCRVDYEPRSFRLEQQPETRS